MTFYRLSLLVFVIGNVGLFTAFMLISSQPWEAALVFLGYIFTNAPIVVSMFTAESIDKTLKGHWLNWLNMLIPFMTGTVGLVTYSKLALVPGAHPAIFFYEPMTITMLWFTSFGVLVTVYVLAADSVHGKSSHFVEQ
jgi:hypothetical protein